MDIPALAETYNRDGYIGGVPILTPGEAATHRASMEAAEEQIGSLHYRSKAHTILTSPLQLATDSTVLDIVNRLLPGHPLLRHLHHQEANAPSRGRHQDSTGVSAMMTRCRCGWRCLWQMMSAAVCGCFPKPCPRSLRA